MSKTLELEALLDYENIKDDDASQCVRVENPQSQFSPDGMIKGLIGKQPINNETTKYISIQNYRMGRFLKEFSKIGFEGLNEEQQEDGSTIYAADMAIDNQDFNFYIDQSEILSSIKLTEVLSEKEIENAASKYDVKPEQTYIVMDGKQYSVRLNIPMHFGTGQNSDSWINFGVFVLGDSILASAIAAAIGRFGIDTFKNALKNLTDALIKTVWALLKGIAKTCYRFIVSFIGRLVAGDAVEVAAAAAKKAAGDAWRDSVKGVNSKTLKYSVVGIIIIVAITLIIELVLHRSSQNVYFYNLTPYDIDIDFPYKDWGDFYNLPTSSIEAKVKRIGPEGKNLGYWYNAVAFRYESDSELNGLGYTMRFKMKEPKTQQVVKTFSCLFDVPYSGDNSLYASTNEPNDYKSYYSDNSGNNKITQYSANDGAQEIVVTYDFLSGKHEEPETGNQSYYYNSLVVIRDMPISPSSNLAAKLKNNGYLSINSCNAYNFGDKDFTFEARIKPSASGTIIGKKSREGGSASYAGFLFVLRPDGGFKLATDNGFGYSETVSGSTNVMNGEWHHIAGIRKGAVLSLYFDGNQLNATQAGSASSPLNVSNNLNLLIGSVEQTQEQYIHYSGAISEVRLWNRALEKSEIQTNLHDNLTGKEQGLVGYWPLHENGNDLSPNKNNATIVGQVSFQNA